MDGWTNGWMNGWMDTWVDGWKAGNDMLTNNKAEMWGKEACTRKTVNVNILQTQFHSCFCVQAKHNSSWPSFTTTGRLRDCFLFALFFWTGDQSVRFLQCFLFTATVQRAADRPEETACTLRRGTCCSTAETSISALSLYFLAFGAHTEWTRGKRLWLGSQYFAVEFKGIPNSNNSRTPGGLRCGLTEKHDHWQKQPLKQFYRDKIQATVVNPSVGSCVHSQNTTKHKALKINSMGTFFYVLCFPQVILKLFI